MGLEENLSAAIAVAKSVRLEVPNSSNTSFTSSYVKSKKGVVHQASESKLRGVRSGLSTALPREPNAWLVSFREVQARCVKAGVGNCGELSAIACLRLRELKAHPVEYVKVWDDVTDNPGVPHFIAVVGRLANQGPDQWPGIGQPLGLPDSWDAAAVICDPWDRVAYPAREYDSYWAGMRKHAAKPDKLSCTLVHQLI